MKRTDLQKRERELRRAQKKEERVAGSGDGSNKSVGDYINEFHGLMFYDEQKIYNTQESIEILDLLDEMKENLDKGQWENVLRKAIRKTGVKEREQPLKELLELIGE